MENADVAYIPDRFKKTGTPKPITLTETIEKYVDFKNELKYLDQLLDLKSNQLTPSLKLMLIDIRRAVNILQDVEIFLNSYHVIKKQLRPLLLTLCDSMDNENTELKE